MGNNKWEKQDKTKLSLQDRLIAAAKDSLHGLDDTGVASDTGLIRNVLLAWITQKIQRHCSQSQSCSPQSVLKGVKTDKISLLLIFKRSWPFLHIKEIEMDLGGIKLNVLFKLLRGVKKLKSFAFTSTSDTTFEFHQLNRELLRCSRGSLHKLDLHDDSESQRYMGRLTGFQNLVEVKINASLLLGCEDEQRRRRYSGRSKHSLSF